MDIYVKASKKVSIYNRASIKVKDIAEVFAPKEILNKIESLPVVHVDESQPKNILISIIDVIKRIDTNFPGNTVNSVGETETLVHFEKQQKPENKAWTWVKAAAVCVILLAGSATAIMTFHTDTQVPAVFRNFYYIFLGETSESMALLDVPYSIGIAVGIIVFFNHFSSRKKLSDPTPIDVEMAIYDDEVVKAIVGEISKDSTIIGKKE